MPKQFKTQAEKSAAIESQFKKLETAVAKVQAVCTEDVRPDMKDIAPKVIRKLITVGKTSELLAKSIEDQIARFQSAPAGISASDQIVIDRMLDAIKEYQKYHALRNTPVQADKTSAKLSLKMTLEDD